MKNIALRIGLLQIVASAYILCALNACADSRGVVKRQVFEPENISTEAIEYASSFSSSGEEVYFARSNGQWGKGNLQSSIYRSVKKGRRWSTPNLVPFSGQYDDSAPHITDDGKILYFVSDRPSSLGEQGSQNIWKVEKDDNGIWGNPVRLNDPINSSGNEYGLCTDGKGNLYFASDREGGHGQGDLYMAKKKNVGFERPQNLGSTINSSTGEWNLELSKDGKILIFEASQRPENRSPYGDLYISFKHDGKWSIPQNLKEINSSGSDLYPEIVEAENRLYYSSSDSLKGTTTNIYFVEFDEILKKYRKNTNFNTRN